jgi:hypothetical protein
MQMLSALRVCATCTLCTGKHLLPNVLSTIDGEKFNLKLPAVVDEYYVIKFKCEEQGWMTLSSSTTTAAAYSPHSQSCMHN